MRHYIATHLWAWRPFFLSKSVVDVGDDVVRGADTYTKLTLMSPNGQEITHSKTSVRRGQPNPLYKETFMFQVAEAQLPEVTLMVSVFYNRNIKRKEMIGWFSLGNTIV